MSHNPAHGSHYLLLGLQLICKPKLRRFVIIPFLINCLIFIGLLALSIHEFGRLNAWVNGLLPNWLHWLNWLLWVLFIAASLLVIIYTFTFFANLIAAPFNGFLSEKVETYLRGNNPLEDQGWLDLAKDIPRMMGREISKLLYFVPRAIILLLLFIIPVVQIVAAPLWLVFSAWMMAIQYADYPMDNHRIPLKSMRKQLQSKGLLSLGFGGSVMLLNFIPIVNFIVMPVAVAGATAMWVEQFADSV